MRYYLYESHMGGYFVTTYELSDDELFCDECFDSDWFVGSFEENNFEEFCELLVEILDTGFHTPDDEDSEFVYGWYTIQNVKEIFERNGYIVSDHFSDGDIINRVYELQLKRYLEEENELE